MFQGPHLLVVPHPFVAFAVTPMIDGTAVLTLSLPPAAAAAAWALRKQIHCLPVVDDSRKVVGIVTRKDILRLNWRDLPMFGN